MSNPKPENVVPLKPASFEAALEAYTYLNRQTPQQVPWIKIGEKLFPGDPLFIEKVRGTLCRLGVIDDCGNGNYLRGAKSTIKVDSNCRDMIVLPTGRTFRIQSIFHLDKLVPPVTMPQASPSSDDESSTTAPQAIRSKPSMTTAFPTVLDAFRLEVAYHVSIRLPHTRPGPVDIKTICQAVGLTTNNEDCERVSGVIDGLVNIQLFERSGNELQLGPSSLVQLNESAAFPVTLEDSLIIKPGCKLLLSKRTAPPAPVIHSEAPIPKPAQPKTPPTNPINLTDESEGESPKIRPVGYHSLEILSMYWPQVTRNTSVRWNTGQLGIKYVADKQYTYDILMLRRKGIICKTDEDGRGYYQKGESHVVKVYFRCQADGNRPVFTTPSGQLVRHGDIIDLDKLFPNNNS